MYWLFPIYVRVCLCCVYVYGDLFQISGEKRISDVNVIFLPI